MPRTLKFYGASDDLFEVEGTKRGEPDEIGAFDCAVSVEVSSDLHTGLIVTGLYSPADNGCWMIGISQLDEDVPLPEWAQHFRVGARGYSAELTLEVPDDVSVSHRGRVPTGSWSATDPA